MAKKHITVYMEKKLIEEMHEHVKKKRGERMTNLWIVEAIREKMGIEK